jgi:hypothetical protein
MALVNRESRGHGHGHGLRMSVFLSIIFLRFPAEQQICIPMAKGDGVLWLNGMEGWTAYFMLKCSGWAWCSLGSYLSIAGWRK